MRKVRVRQSNLIPWLQKVRLLKYLEADAISDLVDRSEFVKYDEGKPIIEEHQVDSHLYVIVEKAVAIHVNENGEDVYVATIGSGEVVGEAAMFTDFKRTATVIALEEMTLLRISREEFLKTLRDNPKGGLKVLFAIIHGLLMRLREVNLELAFERRHQSDQGDVDAIVNSLLGD